jgi:hypothetical protein
MGLLASFVPLFSKTRLPTRPGSFGATFYGSPADTETVKVPKAFIERLTDALCYAARMAKVQLEKLSEKSRMSLQGSLTGHRNGAFRPILASIYLPNSRSERRPHPFQTVSEGKFCELRLLRVLGPSFARSLPALKHAADEKRLVEGSCCGGYPLLYAMHRAI